jgi:glycosyltransferase involved in cell wall biosynthesis
MSVPVSAFVATLNEELNIAAALECLQWADEIWVVDSHSSDLTAEIAAEHGAKVVQFDYPGYGPKKMNWALDNLPFRNEWVLFIDADERVTSSLHEEVAEAVATDNADGYYIDVEYVFLGRALKCKRPNWNLRLFKHRLGRFERLGSNVPQTGDIEVHEQLLLAGRTAYLRSLLVHRDRRSLRAWIDNHNRYSEWETDVYRSFRREPIAIGRVLSPDSVWRRRALKRLWVRLPFRSVGRFLLFYVARRGFLDGRQGFIYSVLMGWYEFLVSAKLYEARLTSIPGQAPHPATDVRAEREVHVG